MSRDIGSIYNQHVNDLFTYGLYLGFKEETIKDAIHDVFVKITMESNRLTDITNIKFYLFRALKNRLLDIHKNLKRHNICDKGFDYEIGFGFDKTELPEALERQNIVVKDNLVSGIKKKAVRTGQFDAKVVEYIPEGNKIAVPKYRNSKLFDFVPVSLPQPNTGSMWKYMPSPWYGAYRPVTTE